MEVEQITSKLLSENGATNVCQGALHYVDKGILFTFGAGPCVCVGGIVYLELNKTITGTPIGAFLAHYDHSYNINDEMSIETDARKVNDSLSELFSHLSQSIKLERMKKHSELSSQFTFYVNWFSTGGWKDNTAKLNILNNVQVPSITSMVYDFFKKNDTYIEAKFINHVYDNEIKGHIDIGSSLSVNMANHVNNPFRAVQIDDLSKESDTVKNIIKCAQSPTFDNRPFTLNFKKSTMCALFNWAQNIYMKQKIQELDENTQTEICQGNYVKWNSLCIPSVEIIIAHYTFHFTSNRKWSDDVKLMLVTIQILMCCVKYDRIRDIVLQNIQKKSNELRVYLKNDGLFFMIVDNIWKQTCFTFQPHNIINIEKSGLKQYITTPNQTFIALRTPSVDWMDTNDWMIISNKTIVVQSSNKNRQNNFEFVQLPFYENLRFVQLPLHVYKDVEKGGDIKSQSAFVALTCTNLKITMDPDSSMFSVRGAVRFNVTSELYHSIQCNDIFARKSTIPYILGKPLAISSIITFSSDSLILSHKTVETARSLYGGRSR
jgi:hypothetical protein